LRVRINIYVVRELCDTSDYAIDIVLGQRIKKKTSYTIYYDSRTLNNAQRNYYTIEKELLDVVFALENFYLIYLVLKLLFTLIMQLFII
jgi:hypothetical protein